MMHPTTIWLMLQCACSPKSPSGEVVWQDDPQDTKINEDTGPEEIILEDLEDTGTEEPLSSPACTSDVEIQIPTWESSRLWKYNTQSNPNIQSLPFFDSIARFSSGLV